jgi:cytochrome b involved in lipid metabolism
MSYNKKLFIGVGILTVLLIGAIFFSQKNTKNPQDTNQVPSSATTSYTKSQVAEHSTATSCWSIIDGKVYDLTDWISRHPGGEQAILILCGKDGTEAFHGQHGDAQRQADVLATMKIGDLAQ